MRVNVFIKVHWCFIHVCFVYVTIWNIVWHSGRAHAPRCTHFPTDICCLIQEGVKWIKKSGHTTRRATHCHLDKTNMDKTSMHVYTVGCRERYVDITSTSGMSTDSKVKLIMSLWQWIRGNFLSPFGGHWVDVQNVQGRRTICPGMLQAGFEPETSGSNSKRSDHWAIHTC